MDPKNMNQTRKEAVFFPLLALAWPAVLEGLLQTVLQYIDTAMVGRLGAAATATVSLSSTYSWLIHSTISALGVGFLSYIARSIGEADERKVECAAGQTVFVTVLIGILLTGVTMWMAPYMPKWMGADKTIWKEATRYFIYINLPMVFRAASIIFGSAIRATGDARTPMYINVFVNLLNIVLNYLMIYRLSMGPTGAGVATGISVSVGGVLMTATFLKNPILQSEKQGLPLSLWKPDIKVLAGIMVIGFPIVLTRMASCLGHIVFTSFVSSMETKVYAAHAIAITAEELFYIPGYGMMSAAATLMGNAVGEGDLKKQKHIRRYSLGMIFALMCVSGILLYMGAEFMMRLFTTDAEVISIGSKLLRMVAFTEPVFGSSAVMEGIYNGMGRTRYPLVVEILTMWGVRVAGAFVCVNSFHLGIVFVWVMMIINNILKAVLLGGGLFFLSRKQGINNENKMPI